MKPLIHLAGALLLGASLVQAQAVGPPSGPSGWESNGLFEVGAMGITSAQFWGANGEVANASLELPSATLAERTRFTMLTTNMGAYGVLSAAHELSFEWHRGASHTTMPWQASALGLHVAQQAQAPRVSNRERSRDSEPEFRSGGNGAPASMWKDEAELDRDSWTSDETFAGLEDGPSMGDDRAASVVPEPASLGLLMLGAGMLLRRRQRSLS